MVTPGDVQGPPGLYSLVLGVRGVYRWGICVSQWNSGIYVFQPFSNSLGLDSSITFHCFQGAAGCTLETTGCDKDWAWVKTVCLTCSAVLLLQSQNIVLFLFGGHIQRCSGLSPGFELMDHSWQAGGSWMLGNEPGLVMCKANIYLLLLLLWFLKP